LEDGKEQQPDGLPDEIVVDQPGLPAVGQVGIQLMHPLEGMVLDMISLKRYRAGHYLRDIGKDACQPVGRRLFEYEFMRAFMYHYEQGVIRKGAQQVGRAYHYPPGLVCYQPGQHYLEGYQSYNRCKSPGIFPDQVPYIGMLLQDLLCPDTVWFAVG